MVYLTYEGQKVLEEIDQNEKYKEKVRRGKNNFNNNLQSFLTNEFPVSRNEGLYGERVVPDDGKIHIRDDLGADTDQGIETRLHECGHDLFNDIDFCEYRTRVVSRDRKKSEVPEEKNKYECLPGEYRR